MAAAWQKKYGALATYSFDVPQAIRDDIYPYLKIVMDEFEGEKTKIAIEDFGLNDNELMEGQLDPNFGFTNEYLP